jgi:hypothetical protein
MKAVITKLAGDTSELISCVGETHGGANYCVNMRRIVDLIRIKEVTLHDDDLLTCCLF